MISTPIPIRQDSDGRLRVGQTRVLLDLVIYSFRLGHTPETIVEQYPSLLLEDVYLAIGYYLGHTAEVDAYLQAQEAETFRHDYEDQHPNKLTREILLARLAAKRELDRK